MSPYWKLVIVFYVTEVLKRIRTRTYTERHQIYIRKKGNWELAVELLQVIIMGMIPFVNMIASIANIVLFFSGDKTIKSLLK